MTLLHSAKLFCNAGPSNLAWAPDARSVALWLVPFGGLRILDTKTKRMRRITVARIGQVLSFAWSPDSSELLVAGRPTYDSCASLWLVRADGSGERLLHRC